MSNPPEIHLFILWSKAQSFRSRILDDLQTSFEVVAIHEVTWSKQTFSENLSRLYGANLPKNSNKELHCGNGTFTCVIVRDMNPVYEIRNTPKGRSVVNTRLFDKKYLYREWTGGGHKIHATDNLEESALQLRLILNTSPEAYEQSPITDQTTTLEEDLVGAKGWGSVEELFAVLEGQVTYVVLRNEETLTALQTSAHPDIDVLTDQPQKLALLLNAKKTKRMPYRVMHSVTIAGRPVSMDIRSPGDGYYCERWERDILKSRRPYEMTYLPSPEQYFYSLLYHALLHKPSIAEDYITRLKGLAASLGLSLDEKDFATSQALDLLIAFMDSHTYAFTEPVDVSVFWNRKVLAGKVPYTSCSLYRRLRTLSGRTLVRDYLLSPVKNLLKVTFPFLR